MMQTPSAHALLATWERGQQRTGADRGLLLLWTAFPDCSWRELAAIPMGRRNRLLLGLRGRLFGLEVEGVTDCTTCGQTLEARLPVTADERLTPGPGDGVHQLSWEGLDIRYRLPTTADIAALPSGDTGYAADWLLLRCVVEVTRDGNEVPAASLPEGARQRVADALGDLDPEGVLELIVACPSCEATTLVPFDPAAFLWAEVAQWAWRVLGEVRDLAAAYGWSEADILAMTPWRRQAHLELLPA